MSCYLLCTVFHSIGTQFYCLADWVQIIPCHPKAWRMAVWGSVMPSTLTMRWLLFLPVVVVLSGRSLLFCSIPWLPFFCMSPCLWAICCSPGKEGTDREGANTREQPNRQEQEQARMHHQPTTTASEPSSAFISLQYSLSIWLVYLPPCGITIAARQAVKFNNRLVAGAVVAGLLLFVLLAGCISAVHWWDNIDGLGAGGGLQWWLPR